MRAVLRRWRDLAMVVLAGAVVAAHVEGRHARTRATSLEARLRATELALVAERSDRPRAQATESAPSPILACAPERETVVTSRVAVTAIDSAVAAPAPDTLARDDTEIHLPLPAIEQVPGPQSRIPTVPRPRLGPTPVYALSLVAGAGANALLHYDPDRGGYVDSWGTEDKWTHFALGALLAQSSMEMGVPARWSVPLTCAGAVGYEASQGYMSWRDATASCGGAVMAAGFRWVLRRTSGEPR